MRRPPRVVRGVALVSALVVSAVVVAVAVSTASLRAGETAMLDALLQGADAQRARLEVEARALEALRADARLSGYDAADEDWAMQPYAVTNRRAAARGTLRDLQARLNLNALLPDPAFAQPARHAAQASVATTPSAPDASRRAAPDDARVARGSPQPRPAGFVGTQGVLPTGPGLASATGAGAAERSASRPPAPAPGAAGKATGEIGCTGGFCGATERPPRPGAGAGRESGAGAPAPGASARASAFGMPATPGVTGETRSRADPHSASTRGRTAAPDPGAAADGTAPPPWQVAADQFTLLVQSLDLDPALVPALVDWLDPDSDTRYPNGAEDEYYLGLEAPYRAANAPLADVSELRLVRGFTAEVVAALAPCVTALPARVPVNVNTAPVEVLATFGPGLGRDVAAQLVAAREAQPFTSTAAFLSHPLLLGRPLLDVPLAVSTSYFELDGRLRTEAAELPFRSRIFRAGGGRAAVVQRTLGAAR